MIFSKCEAQRSCAGFVVTIYEVYLVHNDPKPAEYRLGLLDFG